MAFTDDFAAIVGEGADYRALGYGADGWMIRFEDGGQLNRMIQYRINGGDFEILSLVINDDPQGGGHILRIAKDSVDLFAGFGLERILGYKFDSTAAGLDFQAQALALGGYIEGNFTVLDIADFQKLKGKG